MATAGDTRQILHEKKPAWGEAGLAQQREWTDENRPD